MIQAWGKEMGVLQFCSSFAVPAQRLAELGITADSWRDDIESGVLPGYVCLEKGEIVGYCFANKDTAEIVVLALALRMVLLKLLLLLLDHPNHQADNYGQHQNWHPVSAVSIHPSGARHAAIHHGFVLRQSATCG